MSTKLKLLLDECVTGRIVAEIRDASGVTSVEAVSAGHQLANRKTPDEDIVEYARRLDRVLVTTEGRLNEKKYTICSHPGIIVINATRRYELEKAKLFTRFLQSGHRSAAKHAVTKLRYGANSCRLERGPDGEIREIPIKL